MLGKDPNPRVELHLKEPESRLRGQVVDGRDHVLEGVRIFLQDGGSGEARTDGDGRFELKLGVPPKTRVGLRPNTQARNRKKSSATQAAMAARFPFAGAEGNEAPPASYAGDEKAPDRC